MTTTGRNINDGNKMSFNKIVTQKTIAITVIFILLILCQFFLIIISGNSIKYDIIINDFFARQKMEVQKISLETNRKLSILYSIRKETDETKTDDIQKVIEYVNSVITGKSSNFDMALSLLASNRLPKDGSYLDLSPYQIDDLTDRLETNWMNFRNSINKVVAGETADDEFLKAVEQVNSLTDIILDNIDDINGIIISHYVNNAKFYNIVSCVLFTLTLVLFVLIIIKLYKHIITPLNLLYGGINILSILNKKTHVYLPSSRELSPVINDINESIKKLKRLIELIENISQSISFDDTLKFLYTSFSEFIPYSHIGIALLKEDGKILEASFGISDPSLKGLAQKLYGIRAELSGTSLENVIKKGIPRVINDLDAYPLDTTKTYNRILREAGIKSSITLPLNLNNKPVGIIFFSSTQKNIYEEHHLYFLETLSDSIAISLNKNIFIDELLFSTILALAKMAEARDEETGEHLIRMQKYSVKIAEFLIADKVYENELNFAYLRDIERFSPMHDIGKVGIRDYILLKPGKLTKEEYEEMKNHAIYGAEVLRTAENNMLKHNRSLFRVGIEIAEGHHEKWDGTGYPYGKSGLEIPLSARIVAVADVFDALTSVRPYKKAFPFEESFRIILEGRGKHFDPEIIDSIVRHKDELYSVYRSCYGNFDNKVK